MDMNEKKWWDMNEKEWMKKNIKEELREKMELMAHVIQIICHARMKLDNEKVLHENRIIDNYLYNNCGGAMLDFYNYIENRELSFHYSRQHKRIEILELKNCHTQIFQIRTKYIEKFMSALQELSPYFYDEVWLNINKPEYKKPIDWELWWW